MFEKDGDSKIARKRPSWFRNHVELTYIFLCGIMLSKAFWCLSLILVNINFNSCQNNISFVTILLLYGLNQKLISRFVISFSWWRGLSWKMELELCRNWRNPQVVAHWVNSSQWKRTLVSKDSEKLKFRQMANPKLNQGLHSVTRTNVIVSVVQVK